MLAPANVLFGLKTYLSITTLDPGPITKRVLSRNFSCALPTAPVRIVSPLKIGLATDSVRRPPGPEAVVA